MILDSSEKKRAWLLPEVTKTKLSPALYLVATPIGNLRDITVRALDTLAAVDVIACEDTRVSGKLLKAYDLKKKMMIYNDHADDAQRDKIIAAINDGQSVALISDAGMPLISDPGYKLVKECADRGVVVTSVPGASASLMGLQLSGFASDAFTFVGFVPAKEKARHDFIGKWRDVPSTLIAYETAPRLLKTLEALTDVMPDRHVAVTRELTKMYEQVRRGLPADLCQIYRDDGLPKGEIVLIIEPPQDVLWDEARVRDALKELLIDMPTKKAAAYLAKETGWAKNKLYELALELKNKNE